MKLDTSLKLGVIEAHLHVVQAHRVGAIDKIRACGQDRQRLGISGRRQGNPKPWSELAQHQRRQDGTAPQAQVIENVSGGNLAVHMRARVAHRECGHRQRLLREIHLKCRGRQIPVGRPIRARTGQRAAEIHGGQLPLRSRRILAQVELGGHRELLTRNAAIGIKGRPHGDHLIGGSHAGFQSDVLERHAFIAHPSMLHMQAGERRRRARCAIRVRLDGMRAQVRALPVTPALGVLAQAHIQAVDIHAGDFQPFAQQRQQLDAHRGMRQGQEWLLAESGGISQGGGSQFKGDPGEHRQLDIAAQPQLSPGGFLDGLRDSALVLVRVDEQPHADQRGAQKHDDSSRQTAQNLEVTHAFHSGLRGRS